MTRDMIQGMGFSRIAAFNGVLELICRAFVSWVLIPRIGYPGVCFTNAITWTFAAAFCFIVYFNARKKLIRESAVVYN